MLFECVGGHIRGEGLTRGKSTLCFNHLNSARRSSSRLDSYSASRNRPPLLFSSDGGSASGGKEGIKWWLCELRSALIISRRSLSYVGDGECQSERERKRFEDFCHARSGMVRVRVVRVERFKTATSPERSESKS